MKQLAGKQVAVGTVYQVIAEYFVPYLTPLRQELANLPVEPFFLIFRRYLKIDEKVRIL